MIAADKNKNYLLLLLFFIAIPFIIYFYFLKWKTDTIYGDDLFIFKQYSELHGFFQKINLPTVSGKYRPMHGLSLYLIIEWFQKNLDDYYIFNIAIQTINTFILAKLLNLFLKSPFVSLLFSLILGLSRFSFFNISQLLNGGALEGLAITFFLLSVYHLTKALAKDELAASQKEKQIYISVLFANFSLYTHERYIVLFPFIFLVVLLFPGLKALTQKQKANLCFAALASIVLNVGIKKYVYSMPFFVGTGGTNISFSLQSAATFFVDAVLSIFQINSGPEYLVGRPFSSLPPFAKTIAVTLATGLLLLLVIYLSKSRRVMISKRKENRLNLYIFFSFLLLFGLLLVPAVVTIRLEQRWLQASLSIFILLVVIALSSLQFKSQNVKNGLFGAFIMLFLGIDMNYFHTGAQNLYMNNSEDLASNFKAAIDKGVIRPNITKLYIWEKQRDENVENAIRWSLGDGYFFQFYRNKNVKILFADSIYQKAYAFQVSSFINFNKDAEQIIYTQPHVLDITPNYLQDSLKSFRYLNLDSATTANAVQYSENELQITSDNFEKFSTTGFHENENGIRWTNGNAAIDLQGSYRIEDSLTIVLNTYMPPICKSIVPKLFLVDEQNKRYEAALAKREGDTFFYKLDAGQLSVIQKINILSPPIDASPDVRALSFPFISLELKRK